MFRVHTKSSGGARTLVVHTSTSRRVGILLLLFNPKKKRRNRKLNRQSPFSPRKTRFRWWRCVDGIVDLRCCWMAVVFNKWRRGGASDKRRRGGHRRAPSPCWRVPVATTNLVLPAVLLLLPACRPAGAVQSTDNKNRLPVHYLSPAERHTPHRVSGVNPLCISFSYTPTTRSTPHLFRKHPPAHVRLL